MKRLLLLLALAQTLSAATWTIRVPGTSELAAVRNRNYSLLVTAMSDYATNSFSQNSTALAAHVSITNAQTIGNKTITNSTYEGGYMTNTRLASVILNYYTTNGGIWFYNSDPARRYAIAPGPGGQPSIWDINSDTSLLLPANYNPLPESILNYNIASNRFGRLAGAGSWTGTNTFARITNSVIVNSYLTNSTFDGTIGRITGGSVSSTTLSNITFRGTNNSWMGGMAYGRLNNTTLANGANSGVTFTSSGGYAIFAKLKPGPSAAFSINGMTGGFDGRILHVVNRTGQNWTISNDSGVEPVPENRIYTLTGADVTTTGDGAATFLYDSEDARWTLVALQQ